MLLSSRFLIKSLSHSKQICSPSSLVSSLINSHEISLNIISKRYFSERREFNNNNTTNSGSGSGGGMRYNRRDNFRGDNNRGDNNRGDNNRGDSFPNKREPYNNNNNTGRPTFGGRDNRDRQEMGDRTAFIARTLPTDQQRTVAENKFSQFVETTPDDMEARRRISIAIMANFSKNENSHAVLIFFNKLSGLNKDIVTLSQAHYAIAIKEQLKLGEEAAALKNYETMKKKMVLRQMRE